MYTLGQTFKLRPGQYAAYRQAHDELWPELVAVMLAQQVSMVIYHHEGRLFLFATAPSRAHLEQSHQGPVARRWAESMATLLETDAQGRSIVDQLEPAFAFGAFAAG
jgi:L-rhamnose mutarotase